VRRSAVPSESLALKGLCPVCGKPLTPGVMRRVVELADRPVDETQPCPLDYEGTNRRPYRSLIPLPELLAELLGTGIGSKKVATAYRSLVERAGCEFSLLLDRSESEIESMETYGVSGELLAMAIGRMRSGQVSIKPGYDGEYGLIHAFAPGERIEPKAKAGLFDDEMDANGEKNGALLLKRSPHAEMCASELRAAINIDNAKPQGEERATDGAAAQGASHPAPAAPTAFSLDAAQEAAVHHSGGPALIVAGPGTGKTAVLALRIAHLVQGGLDPSSILAITFTNKAAAELRERIQGTIGKERAAQLMAATFHSFCLSVLREHSSEAGLPAGFLILDEEEKEAFLKSAAAPTKVGAGRGHQKLRRLASYIEERKRFLLLPGDRIPRLGPAAPRGLAELATELGVPPLDADMDAAYAQYRNAQKEAHALDFDDLVARAVRLLAAGPR